MNKTTIVRGANKWHQEMLDYMCRFDGTAEDGKVLRHFERQYRELLRLVEANPATA